MAKIKRAQGMPVNVIIIAAIALIVLFVLAALFTGKIRGLSQDLESCATKQGQCKDSPCGPNEAIVTNAKCDKIGGKEQVCCITVFKKE